MTNQAWNLQGITDTREQLNTHRSKQCDIQDELKKSDLKYLEAKKWVASLRRENAGLKKQLNDYGNTTLDSSSMLNEMRDTIKKQTNQISNYKVLVNQLQDDLKAATASFTKMEVQKLETKEKYKGEIMGMRESNKKLKEDLENAQIDGEEIAEMEAELADLLDEIDEKDDTIKHLNQIIKDLEEDQKKLKKSTEFYKDKFEKSKQQHADPTKMLSFSDSFEDKDNIIKGLNDQCASLKANVSSLKKNLNKTMKKLKEQEKLNDIDSSDVGNLKKQLISLREENARLRSEKEGFQQPIFSKSSVDEIVKTHENVMVSLQSMQTQMEKQLQNIMEMKNTVSNEASVQNQIRLDNEDKENTSSNPLESNVTKNTFQSQTSTTNSLVKKFKRSIEAQSYPQWTSNDAKLVSVSANNDGPLVNTKNQKNIDQSLNSNPSGLTLTTAPSTESDLTEFTISPNGSCDWSSSELPIQNETSDEKVMKEGKVTKEVPLGDWSISDQPIEDDHDDEEEKNTMAVISLDEYKGSRNSEESQLEIPFHVETDTERYGSSQLDGEVVESRQINSNKKASFKFEKLSDCETDASAVSKNSGDELLFSSTKNSKKAAKMKKIRVLFKKSKKKNNEALYARSDSNFEFDKKNEWETF